MDSAEEIQEFIEETKIFFQDDVECHFNWNLEEFDSGSSKVLDNIEAQIRRKELIEETPLMKKWTIKLSYGYEIFKGDQKLGVEIVEEAVKEMESTTDCLFVRYKTSFQHIACSLLATMLLETYAPDLDIQQRLLLTDKLSVIVPKVKILANMSDEEKSGVLGLKADVLRRYGPDGTKAAIPIIKKASSLCPEEFEWKLSHVITLNRMRHFHRSLSLSKADTDLPMEILEELLKSKDVTGDKEVACKYFLAQIHKDMILMQKVDKDQKEKSKAELKRLCKEIHQCKTSSPQIVSFVARQLAFDGQLQLGIDMVEKALEVFPRHIGLHTTISNLFKQSKQFDKVHYHSKIAMDEGGYGAAWIYLENATRNRYFLNHEEFFNNILSQHPFTYKAQTHVYAALFYYFSKRDIERGSKHINSALNADPTFDGLNDCFCSFIFDRVNPLEIAYNQIHVSLEKKLSYRIYSKLKEIQGRITSHVDVTNFTTTTDMVKDLKSKYYQSCELFRKKSVTSGKLPEENGEEQEGNNVSQAMSSSEL